jgi:polyisoprenoid-binding protein YceI
MAQPEKHEPTFLTFTPTSFRPAAKRSTLATLLLVCISILPAATTPRVATVHADEATQASAPVAAKDLVLSLDPGQSKVHFTLGTTLHTVHGTFALKRGRLQFAPDGKASGEIVADAVSGESGDSRRDKKMHQDVLESARFAEVIFHPDRVAGTIPAKGSVTAELHGVLDLHGSTHELTVPVHADLLGDHWTGSGKFRIPYVEWGLKSPSNFFLKADPIVDVELELAGTIAAP